MLACARLLSQAPRPMNSSGRSRTRLRALVAAVLFAAFSWTLLVSISPRLHGCIHDDANRSDHICAITLVASGSYHHAGQPPVINPPQFHDCFTAAASLTPTWVKSLFLSAHIFAHAPPAQSWSVDSSRFLRAEAFSASLTSLNQRAQTQNLFGISPSVWIRSFEWQELFYSC